MLRKLFPNVAQWGADKVLALPVVALFWIAMLASFFGMVGSYLGLCEPAFR